MLFGYVVVLGSLGGCDEGSVAGKYPPPSILAHRDVPDGNTLQMGVNEADSAPESHHVLVVVNRSNETSRKIAEYYAYKRKIPATNVIGLDCSAAEQVTQSEFEYAIRGPLEAKIAASKNRIDYIVMTKGIPIRIGDANGYSVDGQIAAMRLAVAALPSVPDFKDPQLQEKFRQVRNPYLNSTEHFQSDKYHLYLVTRLDGYSLADCKALVDNSLAAKPLNGPFFFDCAPNRATGGYAELQKTLTFANKMLNGKGFTSSVDQSEKFIAPKEKLMGYASWGSNDSSFNESTYHELRFQPGALCETFVSTSGRTFNPTSGGQSLIADLIHQGVTGVKGYVSEPFTFALARPELLFDHYTAGFNLAESFYAASPMIKWKDVMIGDPLCNPYRRD